MADDIAAKNNHSIPYSSFNDANMSDNHIFEIVSDIVEMTCINMSENDLKDIKLQIGGASELDKKEQNMNFLEESEMPVRRSNRIRRSVVKKDEFVSPRSKKTNKSSKGNETLNNVRTTHKGSEILYSKTIDIQSRSSDSNDTSSETSEKISDKHPKYKDAKSLKTEKNKQKDRKHSSQSEKKKLPRKKKSYNKSEDSSDDSKINDNDFEPKKNEKLRDLHERKSSGGKIFEIMNSEYHKSEIQASVPKINEDQNSEMSEKSSESCNLKPVKLKSRWCRSSELEAVMNSDWIHSDNTHVKTEPNENSLAPTGRIPVLISSVKTEPIEIPQTPTETIKEEPSEIKVDSKKIDPSQESSMPIYDHIDENVYRINRKKCKSKKQVRRMVCDCTLTKEEQEYGILGCKEECLNRLLMIECGSRCPIGDACSNRKFQKRDCKKTEIFKTEKKGWGLKTLENISAGEFLMEFVGEILNHKEYRQRAKQYAKEKIVHSYFMALKTDEILDATSRGNLSRFINHSCNPNCETQKWTVNGELRVGVFTKRALELGEELTLDYKFQRYGREAQKCYCGADNCSGFIGGGKQISIDAYSGNRIRKRKESEDKKRDWEDMILEEEIEKLNGSRGLRNRDDTLKLARLMVRADDSTTRHQLMDIILRTEEQACLRLFLDYHGLPLLWSWMTDIVEFDLKAKILQVLSLLPISNKTMLLDSKVISIVEKWHLECTKSNIKSEPCAEKSSPVIGCEDTTDTVIKKLKISDFSDSETDSTSSHTVVDPNNEIVSAVPETDLKANISTDGPLNSDASKENPCDGKESDSNKDFSDSRSKLNIVSLASGLINNWKNLKEVFRIPRLEQQKRKEDEMEVDNNAKEKVQKESSFDSFPKCGDQIQVVISGKNVFSDHHRGYDYEQPEMKLEDCSRRFSQPRVPTVLNKPRQINKPLRRHPYSKSTENELHKIKEDIPKCSTDILPSTLPTGPQVNRGPLLPLPNLSKPPPVAYPPSPNMSFPPPQPSENQSLIYPPPIMYSQSQLPFMGSPAPVLPHNPTGMPPPTSMTTQPPLIQQPPLNTGIPPPCQPIPANQSTVGAPPNANNFLLPQNVPPPTVVSGTTQFLPNQTTPIQSFPPGPSAFTNQNQPVYFLPPQTNLSNNPPPSSYSENLPAQQSSTFPVQPIISVKEESKPVKLPKNWRTATDSEGNVYYYHSITRHTQWDPPSEEDDSDDDDEDSNSEESESSNTPTYDEPKVISTKHSKKKYKKRKPTKAAADTSVAPVRPEVAKKIKELFRTKMSTFIVCCLNAYRKPSCNIGRITSNEDFKYLARKLTHYTMTKELKQCKNVEDLDCNEQVMHKAKDFIKKYMAKYGSVYIRKEKGSPTE